MLSNRSMWRKWLLLFTCWSLISSMAFMSVGISDANAANVHPASVHPASIHTATRAAAGQNRSAANEVGPSKHSRGDGLWTLSAAGEVTHVTYKNGKYVADASRDIPFWTRSCTPNYGISGGQPGEGFGNENRGVFDGLAVSSADKGASTMYAVHSYSNTTTPYKVEEANSGIALYRYREGRGWNTWKITGSEGSWKITEQEVHWNGNCSQGSSSKSASYNPSTSTPNSSGNSPRNYTFDSARTNFSGGAIINAGTPQEAYIFGGTDSTQFQGSNLGGRHGMKIFSFQPGNGGGVVKYLGYIPIESYSTPQSVYSGFTTDAEGNIYAAVGQKWGGNNLNLKVYKLTNVPAEMNNIYGAVTGRQFTFGEDGHWGGTYNFNNKSCGALGGTPNWQVNNTNCTDPFQERYSKKVVETNLEFDEYVDGFTGITIAPDKHVTVGVTLGNSHHGKVVEIDANEVLVDKKKVKYFDAASLSFGQVHQNNDGILNILHTDIEGVLAGQQPEQPKPPRWFTLKKTVENRNGSDQFQVDLNPINGHNNETQYAINHGGAKTTFSGTSGTQQIGLRTKIPSGLFQARIGERGFTNGGYGQKINMAAAYNTKLECTDETNVHVGDAKYDETGKNRYFDITVDPGATGEIYCTLTNTGPTPDAPKPPTPKADVTVYKKFASFYNDLDTFNVGLNYAGFDYASPTGVYYGANFDYEMGSAQVPVGDTITVFERDYDGSVTDYNVDIACYHGGRDNHEAQPFATANFLAQQQGDRQTNVTIPSLRSGSNKISCFVTNTAKQKPAEMKTIKIYKNFDALAQPGDNFKIGFSYPGSQPYTGVTAKGYPAKFDLGLVTQQIPKNQNTINVFEEPKANSGTDLTQYNSTLTCFDGQDNQGNGRNGTKIYESNRDAKNWNNVDISRATSGTVHCFIDNSRKAGRKLHFYKVFQDTDNTNGFLIRAGINGFVPTAGGTVGQPIEIARDVVIPDGNYPLSLYEETENSANINLKNFNISLTCVDRVGVSKTFSGNKTNYQWFTTYNDILPENMTGDITCTLTNRLDAPKTQLSAYKQLKRYENGDQFEVSFVAPGKSPQGTDLQVGSINTSTSKLADTTADGYSVYEIGKHEYQRTADAFNFKFQESARNGAKLSNYSSSVTCKAVNDAGVERDLTVSNLQQTQSTDGTSRTVTGNFTGAESDATVRCYLHNNPNPKQKVKVVLYKQLNRAKLADQFNVGLYQAQSGQAFTGVSPIDTTNAPIADKLRFGNPAVEYEQYKVGEKEFSQSADGVTFRVQETALNGAQLGDYKISIFCASYDYVNHSWNNFGPELPRSGDVGKTTYADVKIPQDKTGEVRCFLRNKAKPSAKTNVVLYKDFKAYNQGDSFNVGLNKNTDDDASYRIGGQDGVSTVGTSTTDLSDGYKRHKIGEIAARPQGQSWFQIWEKPGANTKLSNYTSTLTCKAVGQNGQESPLANPVENRAMSNSSDANTRSFDIIFDSRDVGEVRCYLRNEPKEKSTKVVLFKDLKRANDTDQFSLRLTPMTKYMPNMGTNEVLDYAIRNKQAADTSEYQQVTEAGGLPIDSGYTRYKIGEVPARPDYDFIFNIGESTENNAKFEDYQSSITCNVINEGQDPQVLQSPKDPTKPVSSANPLQPVKDLPVTGDQYRAQPILVTAEQEGEVHCYLRNEPMPKGSVTILKSSRADGSVPLSGSGWKIEQKRGDSWVTYGVIGDNDANKAELEAQKGNGKYIEDANKADSGKVKIGDLPVGTYLVKEILPPAGFQITEEAAAGYEFTVTANDLDQNKTVVNPPAEAPELPFTGGWGTLPYMILGFVLTGGAVMAFVIAKPKKKN